MKKILFILAATFTALLLCSGCKKKAKEDSKTGLEILEIHQKGDHAWYYFTQDGFVQTDNPRNVPLSKAQPYTEAVRISCANNAATTTGANQKAYALVNRLGMLCFEGSKMSIAKDISVFSDRTADNLVFMNDTPVFSVYKSSFFNPLTQEGSSREQLFLVQFDDEAKISYPVINSTNLTDRLYYQVTDFFWDGKDWFCCLKGSDEKINFSYIKFSLGAPLLSISPVTAKGLLNIRESDAQEFRKAMSLKDYKSAPQRIQNMLAGFSSTVPFVLEVKSAGGASSIKYQNELPASTETELNAKAIISQSWSAALFEDGTLFIEGALPGKHILRGGKPVAIRLPKLDQGYIYSDFVISGTSLYAAWEESDFYKIKRSGFLSVDLDSTLYSKVR